MADSANTVRPPSVFDAGVFPVPWDNPANAYVDDSLNASGIWDKSGGNWVSGYFKNFGFDTKIPRNARITGVRVRVDWAGSVTGTIQVTALVNGLGVGTFQSSTYGTQIFNFSNRQWTRDELLDANFYLDIRGMAEEESLPPLADVVNLEFVEVQVDITLFYEKGHA